MPKKTRLLVTTLDLGDPGGVRFSAHQFLEWAQGTGKFDLEFAHGALRKGDPANVTLAALARGKFHPSILTGLYEGRPAHRVGGYFPNVESLRYLSNRSLWKKFLQQFDRHLVISGYAFDAAPLAENNVPYLLWAATDIDSERELTIRSASPLRRFLNSIQMPEIRRRESLALKKADWVFATTEWMRQRLIARGASAQRSSVLPIPTDSQKWRPANTPAPPTIVWAARLNDPRKNTLFLLKAFALLHPQYPAAQLKLIGQLFDDSLAEKAKQLGVDKQVIFTGLLSEKDRIAAFQSSQVFAVPSLQEGFCISAIEALSCELPVVSTRCGGPETFLDEEKGILVDTPEQMANAFLRLFQDQALRENMGRRGREMVQKHFSKSNFDQELRSVFSQVWGIDFTEASLLQPSIAKPSSG